MIMVLVAASVYFLTTPYYEVRWSYVTYGTGNQHLDIANSLNNKVKFDFWYNGDFEKAYNLENHKLGNNWSLVFKDESESIDEVRLESLSLTFDDEILKVSYNKDPLKFGLHDTYEGLIATQTLTLKKVPKKTFVIRITGNLITKYGKSFAFVHTLTGDVNSMSSYYSGFSLLMPTV